MKGATTKELIVGVVFFAILGTLAFFTVVVSGVNPFNPPKKLFVYFDKGVSGLRKGNVVRISGMEVGKVDDMRLIEKGVLVKLVVIPGVQIHPGYSIKVRAFSPLGGKYVDVNRGATEAPPLDLPLTDWPEFSSIEQLEQLVGPKGPVLYADTEAELISELADLAEKIKPTIIEAVENIRDVTAKINDMQGSLGKLVGDPALFDNLASASANLDRATADLASIAAKVNEGDGTLSRLVNDPKLYDSSVQLVDRLGSIATKVDEGRGSVGRLFNDERLADDLARAVSHLETILDKAAHGDGTVAALLNERSLYDELTRSVTELGDLARKLSEARGPLGVLITDEQAGEELRRTIAHLERVSAAIAEGKGTVGRLIMDDRLISEVEATVVQVRESIEDLREQAPINAFTNAVFQAF